MVLLIEPVNDSVFGQPLPAVGHFSKRLRFSLDDKSVKTDFSE